MNRARIARIALGVDVLTRHLVVSAAEHILSLIHIYPCDLCRDTIVGGLPFCKEGMNFADNADSAIKAEDSIQEGSIFCR